MTSANADVRVAVEAMTRGAITFLEKPVLLSELASAIRRALDLDTERREMRKRLAIRSSKLARLTVKEREVFDLVADGRTNRQIANQLQLSLRAVEDRRARLMKKLGTRSVVELVRLHYA